MAVEELRTNAEKLELQTTGAVDTTFPFSRRLGVQCGGFFSNSNYQAFAFSIERCRRFHSEIFNIGSRIRRLFACIAKESTTAIYI